VRREKNQPRNGFTTHLRESFLSHQGFALPLLVWHRLAEYHSPSLNSHAEPPIKGVESRVIRQYMVIPMLGRLFECREASFISNPRVAFGLQQGSNPLGPRVSCRCSEADWRVPCSEAMEDRAPVFAYISGGSSVEVKVLDPPWGGRRTEAYTSIYGHREREDQGSGIEVRRQLLPYMDIESRCRAFPRKFRLYGRR